jgi:hypothetical protein
MDSLSYRCFTSVYLILSSNTIWPRWPAPLFFRHPSLSVGTLPCFYADRCSINPLGALSLLL